MSALISLTPDAQLDTIDEAITLTSAAHTKIQSLLTERNMLDSGLRVFVSGGGCSGMQYGMAIEPAPREFDTVVQHSGVKVFVDPTSMMYLSKASIDYVDNIMGGGFRIDNPNAKTTCGCGHSFRTEDSAEAGGGSCGSGGCGH